MQTWRDQGLNIYWMTLLLDSPDEGPPSVDGAQYWKDQFGLTLSAVAADPGFGMVAGSSVGTPQFTIINPRTMEVVSVESGFADYPAMEQLAMDNAVP